MKPILRIIKCDTYVDNNGVCYVSMTLQTELEGGAKYIQAFNAGMDPNINYLEWEHLKDLSKFGIPTDVYDVEIKSASARRPKRI